MTGRSNLWPRFSAFVDRRGWLSMAYKGFFSRLYQRTGARITRVSAASSNADKARAINAILAEMRAQGWIDASERSSGGLYAEAINAVCMIPAATEFGYGTRQIRYDNGPGATTTANAYSTAQVFSDETDIKVSLDRLDERATNCQYVSLFATWFGDDLRCGECLIKPKVERQLDSDEETPGYPNPADPVEGFPPLPADWRVAGLTRSQADTMSQVSGRPSYGSSPADITIIEAIQELKARGYDVGFTPFLLMDVPASNSKTDPYTGASSQPAYPWRGRITCTPAPGVAGTPDKTALALPQVADFVGTAAPGDFLITPGPLGVDEVIFTGPANEWSYRRFVLHYAYLCKVAGGVETFVIGSEMRGLTWVRESADSHPFVTELKAIAADVKAILPDANIVYAADWSEYNNYDPQDGSSDLIFHLDPLWSDANIDAIGIDNYFPLADWRDGTSHLDYLAGFTSIYKFEYLWSNIYGGEKYDWFYASQSDRDNQIRTDITDGAYGKPWVFRSKDLPNWWSNLHYNRIGGVESATATDWTPESKPIWFMELGCPSVDKGSNQPNVFGDLLSSEGGFPYYSSVEPDVLIQRRHNHAWMRFLDESDVAFSESNNPQSSVYSGRMIDLSRVYIYTWDARPFPDFPDLTTIWSDGSNHPRGHWITGKVDIPPDIQEAFDVALLNARMPRDPQIIDPETGAVRKVWRDYFEAIGYVRGDAIPDVSTEPTDDELAEAINAVISTLELQGRIDLS